MQSSLHILKPSPENRDAWEELYRGYADFYQVQISDDILANVWSWIIDDNNPFYCLVAKEGSELAGLMHFRAMPSPLRGAMVGFLDDLFVNPEFRGVGVVDALFAALENERQTHEWPFSTLDYRGGQLSSAWRL